MVADRIGFTKIKNNKYPSFTDGFFLFKVDFNFILCYNICKGVNEMTDLDLSRFLSYLLRHQPQKLNLQMDKNGYVSVNELIEKINNTEKYKNELTIERLEQIVANDNKKRYSFNEDKSKIRAVQGHSFHVDVAKVSIPPITLYHGTSQEAYDIIKKKGLMKMTRDFVHLSKDIETAENVGMRYAKNKNKLIVLLVDTKKMLADGYKFYVAENGVWLTDHVPPKYITKM